MTNNINPPGGVNLAIAIFALVGAALSIVGFFAHYIPGYQYADLCHTLQDIHLAFAVDDWQWLRDQGSKLWEDYCSVSAHVEPFHHLVTTSWTLSAFNIFTIWRLKRLRERASRLKIELIALSQIRRRKDLQKILSPVSTSTLQPNDASPATRTQDNGVELLASCVPSSRRWWRWWKTPTPQAATWKVDDSSCV